MVAGGGGVRRRAPRGQPLTIEDFRHVRAPLLRRLLGHWLTLCGNERVPRREKLDPVDIPWALPNLWLMRWDPEAERFRYRLVGEELNAVFGGSLAGQVIDDVLEPEMASLANKRLRRIREEVGVTHQIGRIHIGPALVADGERVGLPLTSSGAEIDWVLGCTVWEWRRDRRPDERPRVSVVTTFTPIAPAPG